MPMIEIDTNAREILLKWKRIFGEDIGARFDYSEAIRKADETIIRHQAPCGYTKIYKKKTMARLKHRHDGSQIQPSSILRLQEGARPEEVRKRSKPSSVSSKSPASSRSRRDKSGRFCSKPSRGRSRKSTSCR